MNGRGKGGGIALFWDESIKVELKSYNVRHIDVLITESDGERWRGTFVYGEPRSQDRLKMWTLLRRIKSNAALPWLMIGDFNEAMWQSEHWSRVRRSERQMKDFREALADCDLHDLGFHGVPWTYDNNQRGANNVRVRLDRAVASPAWLGRFRQASITHLVTPSSDHVPLLLERLEEELVHNSVKISRYEAIWEREESFDSVVQQAWGEGEVVRNLGDFKTKMAYTMDELVKWSKSKIGNIKKGIESRRKKLGELRMAGMLDSEPEVKKIKEQLQEMLRREEIWWRQRSQITWLKEGDKNTKYFHLKASWRARKNKVKKLRRPNGSLVSNEKEMGEVARDFFQNLYMKDENLDPTELFNLFQTKITAEMNESLMKPFSEEEIGDVLFQIGHLKAPGSDGFPAHFFQRNWDP